MKGPTGRRCLGQPGGAHVVAHRLGDVAELFGRVEVVSPRRGEHAVDVLEEGGLDDLRVVEEEDGVVWLMPAISYSFLRSSRKSSER